MEKIRSFIKEHWFGICIFLIIILASFLDFYNYDSRWALAHDQARDAIVAREALRQHRVPTLGPFSQAGSFVMGPLWYWEIGVATAIYPNAVLTPWIILTLSYIVSVYLMILIGKDLGGKWLGLIIGFFTAISPSLIAQSGNLTNPSGVAIFSVLSVLFAIKYIKTKRNIYLFLIPFFVSLAINIHLQAIGLITLIPVVLIVQRPNLKSIPLLLAGFILPFVPLIIFDLNHNFYDTRALLDYYFFGQYKIYNPNRWLTYVGLYWPSAWAYVIGGQKILGYFSIVLVSVVTVYLFLKRKIEKPLLFVILTFLLIFVILRYYRGVRFDSYLIFAHPFVLILTGWATYNLIKFNKILGLLLVILLIIGSMKINLLNIFNSTNYALIQAKDWERVLAKTYPGKKFKIYDYRQKYGSNTLPLSLYMSSKNKISDNGIKIGLAVATSSSDFVHPVVFGEIGRYQLFNLDSSTSGELSKEGWFLVNPSTVYQATEEWYYGKKL